MSTQPTSAPREATIVRSTRETTIRCELALDRADAPSISTPIGFLTHMLESFAFHGKFSIKMECQGDIHVDDHHLVEDTAIVLGKAVLEALGDRKGITRFGTGYAPMDESLVRAVIDISGRPHAEIAVPIPREMIGGVAAENVAHFFRSFAENAGITLHLDLIRGVNAHHIVEASFKAVALALRQAVSLSGSTDIPSIKGAL